MEDVFEPVLEVTEYVDGPHKGIALLHGQPHVFSSRFLGKTERRGDLESMDLFNLVPLDAPVNAIPVLAYGQFRAASLQPVHLPGELQRLEVCWHVFVQVSA
jgi:hypothetical protein